MLRDDWQNQRVLRMGANSEYEQQQFDTPAWLDVGWFMSLIADCMEEDALQFRSDDPRSTNSALLLHLLRQFIAFQCNEENVTDPKRIAIEFLTDPEGNVELPEIQSQLATHGSLQEVPCCLLTALHRASYWDAGWQRQNLILPFTWANCARLDYYVRAVMTVNELLLSGIEDRPSLFMALQQDDRIPLDHTDISLLEALGLDAPSNPLARDCWSSIPQFDRINPHLYHCVFWADRLRTQNLSWTDLRAWQQKGQDERESFFCIPDDNNDDGSKGRKGASNFKGTSNERASKGRGRPKGSRSKNAAKGSGKGISVVRGKGVPNDVFDNGEVQRQPAGYMAHAGGADDAPVIEPAPVIGGNAPQTPELLSVGRVPRPSISLLGTFNDQPTRLTFAPTINGNTAATGKGNIQRQPRGQGNPARAPNVANPFLPRDGRRSQQRDNSRVDEFGRDPQQQFDGYMANRNGRSRSPLRDKKQGHKIYAWAFCIC